MALILLRAPCASGRHGWARKIGSVAAQDTTRRRDLRPGGLLASSSMSPEAVERRKRRATRDVEFPGFGLEALRDRMERSLLGTCRPENLGICGCSTRGPLAAPIDPASRTGLRSRAMSLLDPARYASEGYPHAEWTELRRDGTIRWLTPERGDPYWALTRHADIVSVSRQPLRFRNWPRFKASEGAEAFAATPTLITMDPPRHARYRRLISARFTPHALRGIDADIERIAAEILDDLLRDAPGGSCDFVSSVAAPLPIAVIARMMGLPRSEWPVLFRLTNAAIGAFDPEFQQPGEAVAEAVARSQRQLLEYFAAIAEERRERSGDDLLGLMARARVDGEPLPRDELLSYYLILVVAGNETTRNAISGGLLAFLEHPEQWERLRRDASLLDPAVEEILRWTTPVIHMARTAAEDTELRGARIARGDLLAMFYPSANRDEEVFEAPFAFRIDRRPNRHLAFGIGEHFCLGAHLARCELRAMLRQLARRLQHAEIAGPVERLASPNVGGIKRLPIRFELEPGPGRPGSRRA